MKNERMYQIPEDITDFTKAVIQVIEENSYALVKTRSGEVFEVTYDPPRNDEGDYYTGGFNSANSNHCWYCDGTSYKNTTLDIVWLYELYSEPKIEFPTPSSDFGTITNAVVAIPEPEYHTLKVFDAMDLDEELYDYLSDAFLASNDTYCRWYVRDAGENTSDEPLGTQVDQWLLERGASLSEKVLFEFSW